MKELQSKSPTLKLIKGNNQLVMDLATTKFNIIKEKADVDRKLPNGRKGIHKEIR